ncbi:MAG: ABC transporter substrate-binding protein [Hyphomicrobiales bacterium]|nr:ABC transporter substrate-binding protein [Hyphomicrobiales bacterium]
MKLTRRHFGSLAAGAAAMTMAPRLGWAQDSAIRIGAVNPYTGPLAPYGDEVTRCYELAAQWINDAGGIKGRKVEIVRGNATSAQEGIAAAEQLINNDKADILVGTYVSSISNAASEAALGYEKLYWETNALALGLTQRNLPNYVRVGPSSNEFALRSVEGVKEILAGKLGKKVSDMKIWIEHEDSANGTSIQEAQVKLLGEAGATTGVGSHSYKAVDVSDSILRAKNAAPDVWLSTGYVVDTNLLLRTAREQGFAPSAIMLLGVGDTPETLEAVGAEYLEGVLVVSYPRPSVSERFGPGAAKFLELYRKANNRDPIAPQGMNAFVGMKMLFEAIEAAGSTDYKAVVAAAQKMDKPNGSYETGYGLKLDETKQNVRANPIIAQWQGGKVVPVYPTEAAADGTQIVNLPRKA